MAGVLPGVEIHRRRSRVHSHRSHDDPNCQPSFRPSPELPMDEAALRARRRLEERLGYNRHKSVSRVQANDGIGSKIFGKSWKIQFSNRRRSKGSLCAVCLDEFGGLDEDEQGVMELPCSHKYHSDCLLPWLADHPNCPSCRSPVQN